MSVDCSIDSLDVPLKRPMFESTVIGEVATELQMEPHPPHTAGPGVMVGAPGMHCHDDRKLQPQVHYEGVDTSELCPQLQHVVMDTTELEHCSQSCHDNSGGDRRSTMPELYQQLQLQPQRQDDHDNSTTSVLCPQFHHDTPATKHCQAHDEKADTLSVHHNTVGNTTPSVHHNTVGNSTPSVHHNTVGNTTPSVHHNTVGNTTPSTCEAKHSSAIETADISGASEVSDSDDFFERESHTPSLNDLPRVETGYPEDIVPCQLISHALSSSYLPQQSGYNVALRETSRDEECLEDRPRISAHRCFRKVSKLNKDSSASIVLPTDIQLQGTGCTSSGESVESPVHHVYPNAVLRPVFKSRVDPHTQCFQEIAPNLSGLRISESSAPQKNRNDGVVLSPWEKWMIKKTKEDMERKERLRREMVDKKHVDEEAKDNAARNVEKAADVHKKWVEQKKAESRARREREHKKRVTQKHKEEQKQQTSQAKADACYEKWCNEREEQRRQLRWKERKEAEEKAQMEREVRQQSEHAYKVWLQTLGCKKTYGELLNWTQDLESTRWNY